MKQLETIKEQLVSQVAAQMGDLRKVDAKELGEVIDMIKDLSEAMYYCEIYKQMTEEKAPSNNNYYYTEKYYPSQMYYRDMDRQSGRMYFPDSSNSTQNSSSSQSQGSSGRNYYTERDYPLYLRDEREGKSPMKRKMYMESKDMHHDSSKTMQELEDYMNELTSDMMEMIDKATPDEKSTLQKKIKTLSEKVQNV